MKIIIAEQTTSGCVEHEYTLGSDVIFGLTRECDVSAQYYGSGTNKKEIAGMKFRAASTVNNQTQEAIEKTGVRNGRELGFLAAFKIVEKLLDVKVIIVSCLLTILCIDSHLEARRQRTRTRSNTNVELTCRVRSRMRGRDIPLFYGT